MFGMYDGLPIYFSDVGFTRKQKKRYFQLCTKPLDEMTEEEKKELKSMYEYASDKNNLTPEMKDFYSRNGFFGANGVFAH